MVFIREGIDTLKCGPIIQDLAIDEDIRGLDLDDIVLQSDQAFDVEIAAGRGWDFRNVGCVEHNDLTAARLAEVVTDLIHKNMVAARAKPVGFIHVPLEDDPSDAIENRWWSDAVQRWGLVGWRKHSIQCRLHRAGRNFEWLDEKRPHRHGHNDRDQQHLDVLAQGRRLLYRQRAVDFLFQFIGPRGGSPGVFHFQRLLQLTDLGRDREDLTGREQVAIDPQPLPRALDHFPRTF